MSSRQPSDHGWLAYYRGLIGGWTRRNERRAEAEDAAHDVVANLLREGDEAVVDAKAYLYGATRLRLTGELRRQSARERIALEDLADAEHPQQADPEADLRAAQLADALKRALAELPLKTQQVFLWHKLEGYTHAEIAAKLGLSHSSIEKHMRRALSHIHRRLQAYAPN